MAELNPWGQPESSPFKEELTRMSQKRAEFVNSGSDKDMLIHPKFPPMGVIKPSHLGSQSKTPSQESNYYSQTDHEERMPAEFMPDYNEWK